MVPRDRVDIYDPTTLKNGSGGRVLQNSQGTLLISALAQVKELKPTREQLAEQPRLGQTLEIKLWARQKVELKAGHVLYWKEVAYTLVGPPQSTNILRTEWVLYAKTLSA